MGIHSDSIYKDTQREVEAKKVDTEQVVGKDAEGNIFAKIEDAVDGGVIRLYNDEGVEQGNLLIHHTGTFRLGSSVGVFIRDPLLLNDDLDGRGKNIKDVNSYSNTALDSAPAGPKNQAVYLASPLWDPDGDGNGELVITDDGGTTWHEIVDLPNYT